MINFSNFSTYVEERCIGTIEEFISNKDEILVESISEPLVLDEIYGPSVEVTGEVLNYVCILEYQTEDNQKILDLLFEKYPFIKNDEMPEVDILDFLGEFLNILCGKINKDLEKIDEKLSIEIPYFTYGLFLEDSQSMATKKFIFGDFKFKLHFLLS